MDRDGADLGFGPDAHVWAEQADAGGHDIVHPPLLEIAAGVFPHELDREVAGEHLPVVRVAAEVEIDARVRELL